MVDYSNIPRDSRRVPLATKVQFKFDRFSGFLSEYSANISPTGMYIVSSNPEPPGRVLDLEFRLGDGFEIIQGKGEVVWSRSVADGPNRPPGMGIRFVELSEGSKDLIYRIVDRYVQEGGTPFDLTTAGDRLDEPRPAAPPVPKAPVASAAAAAPFSDLPPLDLEQHPFPDLDLDPVKDSSGHALPWFSAGPGETPAGPAAGSGPAARDEEPVELFPSIGPALEEVEDLPMAPPAPAPAVAPSPARVPPPEPLPAPAPLLFPSAAPAPLRPERQAPPPMAFAPEQPARGPAVPADLFAAFDPDLSAGPAGPAVPEEPASAESAALSDPGLFADYLPKTAARSETPARRPLASVAGSAVAHEQPRRMSPLLLVVGVLAVLAVAGFLLRDRITGLLGLGGDDEKVVSTQTPPRHPRRKPGAAAPPVVQDGMTSGLTPDMNPPPPSPAASVAADPALTPSPAPAATPAAVEKPAPPRPQPAISAAQSTPPGPPEVVQRKRTPAPVPPPVPAPPPPVQAAGPALTAVDRITFEESMGGTDIVLWGNGTIRPESYTKSQMGDPPRVLIVVNGVQKPFPQPRIPVGTGEVKDVRIGYHDAPKGHALHVVIDLAGSKVKVSRVDHDGLRLRIHLQKG